MTNQFREVPRAEIPRSSFDLSHGVKTTFNGGLLIPILAMDVVPGDTLNCSLTAFARLATPIKPIMDNMYMDTHFFAIPNRLIWDNWPKFCGERKNPGDSVDFTVPRIRSPDGGGYSAESLSDYLGIPIGINGLFHSALWHRAYNLCWNEWFRHQDLQSSVTVPTGDGPDDPTTYTLLRRGKRHDYFTSCLPWPQKGEAVSLPLGQAAPISGIGTTPSFSWGAGGQFTDTVGTRTWNASVSSGGVNIEGDQTGTGGSPQIFADLTQATATTINELRQAFQIQKLLERDARGGTRLIEIVKSHFGVHSPDLRATRPEYLGGGSTPVNVNPIQQTSETTQTTPQGNLAGVGTVALDGHGFTWSATEHCVILGLVSVRADLTYQQGLERQFSRQTRYDYYWPALSHIGEQAVLNKEIYAQGNAAPGVDDQVFGYQERFGEYRYKPSLVTGKFRSKANENLDVWHLSQNFAQLPVLNASFIEDKPPIERVIAVNTEPHFLFDGYFRMRAARPMPMYGVPGLIDHF